jgi:hypothetical protein
MEKEQNAPRRDPGLESSGNIRMGGNQPPKSCRVRAKFSKTGYRFGALGSTVFARDPQVDG